jgi:hypothetical protein
MLGDGCPGHRQRASRRGRCRSRANTTCSVQNPGGHATEADGGSPDFDHRSPHTRVPSTLRPRWTQWSRCTTSRARSPPRSALSVITSAPRCPSHGAFLIADNASTNETHRGPLERGGRQPKRERPGASSAHACEPRDADVLCYMDVDPSSDLRAMLPLLVPVVLGHSDVAIGTRLA